MIIHQLGQTGLKSWVQQKLCDLQEILDYPRLNVGRELKLIALKESVAYAQEHMISAVAARSNKEILQIALDAVKKPGYYLEFGVFRGSTINFIGKSKPQETIHGFDSFKGLPDAWSGTTYSFDLGGELPAVPSNVKLHVGLFDQTLPGWLEANKGDVTFLHVDCDIYSSTKCVFKGLGDRIKSGTIIVFDEYFNYPGWQDHEFKAFREFIARSGLTYKYLAYARFQIVVRID